MLHSISGRGKGGSFTAHQVNPRADTHLLTLLHHLQCLIEQDLARQGVVNNFDDAVREGEASSRGILLHADATAECEFDDDASSQSI